MGAFSNVVFFNAIVQLIYCQATNHEVAVIIGGTNSSHDFKDVEVYSYFDHLKKSCSNGEYPSVPDLQIPLVGASAVYVPEMGIYVCGGVDVTDDGYKANKDCFRYDPKENNEYNLIYSILYQ